MEGNFCCQKSNIPYTSIGRDHCGEQQNKVMKGRGGVSRQSSNANSSNRYFLTTPILSQIFSEMFSIGGMNDGKNAIHHQLRVSYPRKQNAWVVSLLRRFEKQSLFLSATDCAVLQLFSDEIYQDLINVYDKGKKLYETFVTERLSPESTINIFVKLKKANINLQTKESR